MERSKHKISDREVTPLTKDDCLLVFDRVKTHFDFPIHFHPEYEINFVYNATMAQRVVGDQIEYIDDLDLVLTGPNLQHGWLDGKMGNREIREITIQFQKDLFHSTLLERNIMSNINELLKNSTRGVKFSKPTAQLLQLRIEKIISSNGSQSLIELLDILTTLANSNDKVLLTSTNFELEELEKSEKMRTIYQYIQANFQLSMKLKEIANEHNMTPITFGRFMKRETGKTFIEYLNHFRIGYAAQQLINSNFSITEIAFNSGFNNLANFNRIFKQLHGCTPTEYKLNFTGIKRIL